MAHRRKRDLGRQQHAEGQHGDKTHRRFLQQLQEAQAPREPGTGRPIEGHHRMSEDREQHDEAEKNSEAVK
jgi:hypothetical protein